MVETRMVEKMSGEFQRKRGRDLEAEIHLE